MLKVRFHNCREMRMGSPFDNCDLKAAGDWIPPELQEPRDWVKIKALSADNRRLALACWETPGNVPGFRILVIDTAARRVQISERLPGCCNGLKFDAEGLQWQAFPDLSGALALDA